MGLMTKDQVVAEQRWGYCCKLVGLFFPPLHLQSYSELEAL